jgi:hypothetical protein
MSEITRDVAGANEEIVRIITAKSVEGALKWQQNGQNFLCKVSAKLSAALTVEGDILRVKEWKQFIVFKNGEVLFEANYPNTRNQGFGLKVVSNEMKLQIDQVFALLKDRAYDEIYGDTLRELRSL